MLCNQILEKHTFSNEQVAILVSIIRTFNYGPNNEKTFVVKKGISSIEITNLDTLLTILDYNIDCLQKLTNNGSFYVLELPIEEMVQLKLVI